jgi:ADP-heptose:LPS heptosyltransferase
MPEVAQSAAALLPVVVFHDSALPGYDAPGVIPAFDLDLTLGLAVAAEARMVIAPDSSFLHLAGARDLPCVLISGPTNGKLRARSYPKAIVVCMSETFRCMPCWRNSSTPCKVTGGADSVCLDLLPVERVMQAVRECLVVAAPTQDAPPRDMMPPETAAEAMASEAIARKEIAR